MDRFVSPKDGYKFITSASRDFIRSKYRVTRASGDVEIHVVDIYSAVPGADYIVTHLNKGDLLEIIF